MRTIFRDHSRLVPAALLLYLAVAYASVLNKTFTYDEWTHYSYGERISERNAERGSTDSQMPFSALNSIPVHLTEMLGIRNLYTDRKLFNFARMMTTLAALGLAVMVYLWSRELYGPSAGLFSLALFLLDPNILANSRLITTDLYSSLMIFASCYFFWKFLKHPNLKTGILSSLTLGIAQLAKYTCIFLYPIFIVVLVLNWLSTTRIASQRPGSYRHKFGARRFVAYLALHAVVSIIIINLGFNGLGSGTPLKNYDFNSQILQSIANTPVLGSAPVPLPAPYIEGLDRVKAHETSGDSFGNVYLLGQLRSPEHGRLDGFKSYYLVCWLLKVPLPTQFFIAAALILFVRRLHQSKHRRSDVFLIAPPILFLLYFSFFYSANIGIRHILMVFPFFYVLCGSLLADYCPADVSNRKWIFGGLIWLSASVASYFPHYLSYFNELIYDRTDAYKYLADSNLDWGQNRSYLYDYRKENKDVVYSPEKPTAGTIVVGANDLVGVFRPERFKWLRDNFEPIDHVAYSYLVFRVDQKTLDNL